MKHFAILAATLAALSLPAVAQESTDEEPGFFGRLFGGGDDAEEDEGGFLERLIEDNLSGDGRDVSITGFEGALSSEATLESLTISDPDGIWLELNNVVLDWSRASLLRGRLEITNLSAGEIIMPRPPLPAEGEPPTPEASGFSLPELPVSVNIERIAADRVSLGQAVAGIPIEASVTGALSLADGEGSATLNIDRLDGDGQIALDASYANASQQLAVNLDVVEGPDGIVANLIDLPNRPALEFSISGDAPLSDFVANIRLATDGQERLTGTVATSAPEGAPDGTLRIVADLGGDIAPVFAPDYQAFFGPDVALDAVVTTFPTGRLTVENLAVSAEALSLEGRVIVGEDGLPDEIELTGAIGSESGAVLLPLSGPETRVDDVDLSVRFNADEGERWTARFEIAGLDRPGFSAEALTLDGGGIIASTPEAAVTADLDFEATRLDLGNPEAEEALGETVTGGMVIDWSAGDPVRITDLAIDGESYGLSGRADISPSDDGPQVDGAISVRAERISVFSGLAGRTLGGAANLDVEFEAEPLGGFFDVTVSGETNDLVVSQEQADAILDGAVQLALTASRDETGIRANLETLETPNANLTGQASLKSGGSTFSVSGSLAEANILIPDVSGPIRLTASGEEDQDRVWTWSVDAALDGTRLAASGSALDLYGTPVIAATGRVEADDLADFSTLANRPLAGAVALDFAGEVVADLSRLDASLNGTVTDIETGIPQADALLLGEVAVNIDAAMAGEVYSLRNSTISGPQIDVTADATLLPGAGRFDVSGRIADAARVLDGAPSGPLVFDAEGQQDNVDWTVNATANGGGVDLLVDGVALDVQNAPGFDGRIRADVADLSVFAELANRALAGRVSIDATGTATADLSQLDLTAEVDANDLAIGDPRFDPILAGPLAASFAAERTGDTIDVSQLSLDGRAVDAQAQSLSVELGEVPLVGGTATVNLRDLSVFSALAGRSLGGQARLDAEGEVSADLATIDMAATLTSQDVVTGDARFDPIVAGNITARVDAVRTGDAITATVLQVNGDTLALDADGLRLTLGEVPTAEGDISAQATDLSVFSGLANMPLRGEISLTASGSGASDLSTFDVTASADGSGIAIGNQQADAVLAGDLTAQLNASKSGEDIVLETLTLSTGLLNVNADGTLGSAGSQIALNARLADIAPFVSGFSGPLTVDGTVGQEGQSYLLDITANGPGGTTANIAGSTATDFSTVALDVNGNAPLGLANQFIGPRAVSGTASFDLTVNGPPGLNSVSGRISAPNASLVDPSAGISLGQINLGVNIAGGQAQLDTTAAVDAGGSIRISGPLQLSAPFRSDISIALNSVVLSDPRLYETIVNGTLSINGPLTGGARIAGDLRLGETNIRIPASGLGGGGAVPEILHLNETPPIRRTRARAGLLDGGNGSGGGSAGPGFPLDIVVTAPNRVFIRGRGLDSEFGGRVRISGTTNNVIPSGGFELIRGRLDILGQRLEITEATVTLQGSFTPVIRIRAATDVEDFDIFITVSGPASDPDITFSSEPDLPEEEVLSRLLFGRGLDTLSPLQAARLALAVRTLAGRGGEGIVGNLRDTVGLADFDVTTGDDGEAAVRAGAYISDNIYTDVTVTATGETEVNLNLDVSRSITVKGSVSNEGETSIGIFFERDY